VELRGARSEYLVSPSDPYRFFFFSVMYCDHWESRETDAQQKNAIYLRSVSTLLWKGSDTWDFMISALISKLIFAHVAFSLRENLFNLQANTDFTCLISDFTRQGVQDFKKSRTLVSCPDRFLLCWGRERKGVVDLRMRFCLTASSKNPGTILIYHVYLYCSVVYVVN